MKKAVILLSLLFVSLFGCNKETIEIGKSESDTPKESEYNSRTLTSQEFLDYRQSFIEVCCNDGTVIALTSDGDVITWGNNYNGKIGNGNIESHIPDTQITPVEPFLIDFTQNIISVGNSLNVSYAITDSSEIYMWGRNDFGETGIVSGNILEPQKLNIKSEIEKIASGNATNLFLTRDGNVYVAGIDVLLYDNIDDLNQNVAYEYNFDISEEPVPLISAEPGYTEIGIPFKCKDVSIGLLHYGFLSEKGDVYIQGTLLGDYNRNTPNITHNELYKIDFPEKIIDIESGSNFIVALSISGNIYLYGKKESMFFNENSDTEIAENIFIKGGVKNIVSISCNLYCVTMVDVGGNAYGFGIDNWGAIDNKNCDADPAVYEIIYQPRKLNYSGVKKCTTDGLNSVIILDSGQIFIQGADGAKQISYLNKIQ